MKNIRFLLGLLIVACACNISAMNLFNMDNAKKLGIGVGVAGIIGAECLMRKSVPVTSFNENSHITSHHLIPAAACAAGLYFGKDALPDGAAKLGTRLLPTLIGGALIDKKIRNLCRPIFGTADTQSKDKLNLLSGLSYGIGFGLTHLGLSFINAKLGTNL